MKQSSLWISSSLNYLPLAERFILHRRTLTTFVEIRSSDIKTEVL